MSVPSVFLDILCVDGYRDTETVWFDLRDYLTTAPESWVNLAWLKRQGGFVYPLEIAGNLRWEFHFRLKSFKGWGVLSVRVFHQGQGVSGIALTPMELQLVERLFDAQEVGHLSWGTVRHHRVLLFKRSAEFFMTRARLLDWYLIRTLETQHGGLEAPQGPLPMAREVLQAITGLRKVFDADEMLEFETEQEESTFFKLTSRIVETLGEEEAHAVHQLLKG